MINGWSSKGDIYASYRKDGALEVRKIGKAEYTAYQKTGARVPDGVTRCEKEFPGWTKLWFNDYDTRKAALLSDPSLFEADISPVRRFVTDNLTKLDAPKRAYFDIETNPEVPFSRKEQTRLLCAVVKGEDGVVDRFCLENDSDAAEAELWDEVYKSLAKYDQIMAWNGDGFDFPVMEARIKHLLPLRKFQAYWENSRRLLFVDQMAAYKRFNTAAESGDEKTSMALQSVAMALVGEGKSDFHAKDGMKAWRAGGAARQELVDYCEQDVALLPRIEAKTGHLEIFQTLCKLTTAFPSSHGLKPIAQFDAMLLRKARLAKTHLPSKIDRSVTPYEGAFVMESKVRGIMRTVHVCDFASLYPSVIRTFNMGWETKGQEGGCIAPGTEVKFGNASESILAGVIRECMELRTVWKKKKASLTPGTEEWKDADRISTAYKVFVNSGYGVIGSPWSRFYDQEIVESVTLGGQWLIKETIKEAERKDGVHMQAVYGDSVTPDRTTVVKRPDGNVDILTFDELWSLGSNEVVERDKEFRTLPGFKTLTSEGWQQVNAIIRHQCEKQIHRITTKHGQVDVTSDHSIVCNGEKTTPLEFTSKRLKFDVVAAPREESPDVVDLFDYVKDFEVSRPYKGRQLTRRFAPIGDDRIALVGWGDPTQNTIRRFYKRDSEEFAALVWLLAVYVGDGSASINGVTTSRYLLSFCKQFLNVSEKTKRCLQVIAPDSKLFGPYWSDTVYIVRSGTASLACLFAALCGSKSNHKKLPPFMFQLTSTGFRNFWEGLSSADGDIDVSGAMKYSTNSEKLIAGVSYILSQHSVAHSFNFRESKNAWCLRTRNSGERVSRYNIKHEERNYSGYVYDLSVENTHTFVDGVGRVLLHNTDSCFVTGCTVEEFDSFVEWCNTDLYPRLLRERGCNPAQACVKLSYEKCFDRLVVPRGSDGEPVGKRYAASYKHYEGKVGLPICPPGVQWDPKKYSNPEIKGLEYKRADSVRFARRMQEECILMILSGIEDTAYLGDWLQSKRNEVMVGNLELTDIVVSKSISRSLDAYASSGPHVRIAREMQAAGEDVSEGTRIAYVVSDAGQSPVGVISADRYDGTNIDRWYYWNKAIAPATIRLLAGAFPNVDWNRWLTRRPTYVPREQLSLLT